MDSHDPAAPRPAAQAARTLGLRLLDTLTRNWWVLLLRGLAAIAFGVMAWMWPGLSIATLVLLFGIFAFADGALGHRAQPALSAILMSLRTAGVGWAPVPSQWLTRSMSSSTSDGFGCGL